MKILQKLAIRFARLQIASLSLFSSAWAARRAFTIFCTTHGKRKYERSPLLLSAEKLHVEFEGMNTRGYRWNAGGIHKLLIAHGFSSSVVNFQHFIQSFINKGYEVVAFDSPAHGYSQGKTINALQYKNFINTVIERYGPFDRFFAHSLGGLAISLAVTEEHDNENMKIALVSPAAKISTVIPIFFKQMLIRNEKVQHHFVKHIEKISQHDIEWFSIQRCLPQLHSQVLWVHDKKDKVTPISDALDIQKSTPKNISFIFTKGLGHRRIYRDKTVVDAVVNFL